MISDLLIRTEIAEVSEGVSQVLLRGKDSSLMQGDDLLFIALFCRFTRTHPYVVVRVDESRFSGQSQSDDLAYLDSLKTVSLSNGKTGKSVGCGDFSSFLPHQEDEFLLFLQQPVDSVPAWPHLLTDLDSILVSQTDEFLSVSTCSESILKILTAIPTLSPD